MTERQRRLARIAEITFRWELRWAGRFKVDTKYPDGDRSQYPEGAALVSAPARAQKELVDAIAADVIPPRWPA